MTYNIHRWEGRDRRLDLGRLAEVIQASDADVIGLNEVLHPVVMQGRTYAPLAELAERLGMYYAFGPSGWMDYGPAWQGPVGNALLSRYPLGDITNTLLPKLANSKQRSLLSATMASGPMLGLTAFVTHLDHAFEGTRLLQIQGVLRRIAQRGPHFLVGDFNTPGFLGRKSRLLLPPVLREMRRAGYQDAFHAVGEGPAWTFPVARADGAHRLPLSAMPLGPRPALSPHPYRQRDARGLRPPAVVGGVGLARTRGDRGLLTLRMELTLKVLTYNVHGWRTPADRSNLDLLADVIADSGADLVGLNEVFHPQLPPGTRAGGIGCSFRHGLCLRPHYLRCASAWPSTLRQRRTQPMAHPSIRRASPGPHDHVRQAWSAGGTRAAAGWAALLRSTSFTSTTGPRRCGWSNGRSEHLAAARSGPAPPAHG